MKTILLVSLRWLQWHQHRSSHKAFDGPIYFGRFSNFGPCFLLFTPGLWADLSKLELSALTNYDTLTWNVASLDKFEKHAHDESGNEEVTTKIDDDKTRHNEATPKALSNLWLFTLHQTFSIRQWITKGCPTKHKHVDTCLEHAFHLNISRGQLFQAQKNY